ncbi:GNAT family N-acetyltransferase [Aspergillus stella-maris]|uniref:GNAT family N-acetyltransferase n=1 Tax=Aspergillus stella-maris TaxID=1810926 RepID=UPI003CCD7AF7
MTQTWTLSPCTVKDGPALAANNIPAFHDDPTTAWALLWSRETELDFLVERAAMRQPRNLLRDREIMRHQKAVDSRTGEIVGYARWVLPSSGKFPQGSIPWQEAQVPPVNADEEAQFAKQAETAWWSPRSDMMNMDDEIQAAVRRYMADQDQGYIQLEYLAVHPSHQGSGIGTSLVKSGLSFADEHGVPVYTIAFSSGRGIYTRLGFREVARVVQDLAPYGGEGQYATFCMVMDGGGV